ncbi:hypothetical protein [Geitlerinema sp. PCC 7407]|uniref:hypothetical protein n=1 Tax=Geitlerinema sp. PCC 7407 TaxID=1173025 RepID=UPI00167FB21F|nr:hypothetical protein [Geitlerinema sp. PCC 7407]
MASTFPTPWSLLLHAIAATAAVTLLASDLTQWVPVSPIPSANGSLVAPLDSRSPLSSP